MIKKLLIIFLFSLPVLASDIKMQNRELSKNDMKSQNRKIVELAAAEMSKSLPNVIDKYTKLVSVKADKTTLVYIYEINTTPKSDETVKKEDHSRMKEAITIGTCKNSKRFLEADISLRYIYKSANSKAELFQFNINQESCFKI
ncbi:MAG: hypothetical protein L3J19_03870 [Sulfurimonas sp.]|nr:hypothetical protein [Sulfurimonas sp.]